MEKHGPGGAAGNPAGDRGARHPGRIGAYRLLARLGSGGMGEVHLARSDRGRTVAVKLVREELARQEEFRARFRQEVQNARQVGGDWTAPVLDADTEAPVPWVATGYVAGPNLQQVVGHDHGALPERSVRVLAAGLAHALKDIHAAGIVHRDLKPSNVLVTIDGPRVIDFGIARALETVTDGGLTRTGALVGSPGFMAPEQVRGDRITPACDVFCLGSVLAYAATGELPFGTAHSGVHALMFRIAEEKPDLRRVPEGLADLVQDCLVKDPARRPTLDQILRRTGAEDTVADGRCREPWLPGALVAQLGRHAVRLLDAEDPQAPPPGPDGPAPAATPDHAPAADGSAPPAPGAPRDGAVVGHLPTLVTGPNGPAAPPVPAPGAPAAGQPPAAYGHPQPYARQQAQPHPQPSGYGSPHNGYGAAGATPAYGPPPFGTAPPPYGPARPPRDHRSTALLVVIALVVALAAGGTVYALMNGGAGDTAGGSPSGTPGEGTSQGTDGTDGSDPSPDGKSSAGTDAAGGTAGTGRPTPSPAADGTVPAGYLGTWSTTIDNASGLHTRTLTIQQGEAGDTVMSLVAEGPTGNGTYHCVFEGDLAGAPGPGEQLEIGPTTVTVGRPRSACTPGAATDITLLPDGTLRRVNTGNGDQLTYTRVDTGH
ncbi:MULTISPECIES: serine/threonine-protein kinase [unclassified Streptomyces]|uniref:serine/threonine-protein kinase n=1 Tax=unclassified Streptomyces TaxID=2593676 RepID=UPI00086A405D|nr:serine/threonine-protein kinase [Streptomyces sp. AVP053U2]ODA73313.1 Serine/threonine-protein kinase AfsK [Streptomyces sp. AVP053U2]